MISFTTGTTVTNPNNNKTDRHIEVKLSSTGQTVKAVAIFGLHLDPREQCPNIKEGTEVGLIYIKPSTFLAVGSTNLQSDLIGAKKYRIENADEVEIQTDGTLNIHGVSGNIGTTDIKTDKLSVSNGGNELISILSELVQACHDIIDNDSTPNNPATKTNFANIKAKIDTFK